MEFNENFIQQGITILDLDFTMFLDLCTISSSTVHSTITNSYIGGQQSVIDFRILKLDEVKKMTRMDISRDLNITYL